MDAQQFAYWLQGFAELGGDTPPSKAQWKSIREHLGLVFKKVTPPVQTAPVDLSKMVWPQQPKTGDPFPLPPYRLECTSGIVAQRIDTQTIC